MPRVKQPKSVLTDAESAFLTARAWTFTVPDWHPTPLNRLMRMHWTRRRGTLRIEADVIAIYASFARVPRATGKRRVTQRLTLWRNDRERDDDNAWKGLLDCLVKAGLLVDDGPRWVDRAPLEFDRSKVRRSTVITLEDVTDEPKGA